MRKILLAIALFIGVAAAAVLGIYLFVDVNQFRGLIQADLQRQLHRSVTLGAMSLGLFPLGVRADDVSIGENPRFSTGRPFATAKRIQVRAELIPLLRKQIRVDSIDVQQPSIELVTNSAGESNISDLVRPSSPGSGPSFSLSALRITDGQIAVSTLGAPAARSVYDRIDIAATDLRPGSGKITITGAPVSALGSLTGSRLTMDGLISGSSNIHTSGSVETIEGRFDLKNARENGKDLGIPIALEYSLAENLNTGVLHSSKLTLTAGKVSIDGSLDLDTKASNLNAAGRLGNASLSEVLTLARLFGVSGVSGTGEVSFNIGVKGSLKGALTYSGGGALRNAQISVPGLTKPLGLSSADLKFDRNSASIDQLTASLGSTHFNGSAAIANFDSSAPVLTFNLNADKIDVDELQRLSAPAQSGNKAQPVPAGNIAANGNIRIGALVSQGLTLSNVQAQCVYKDKLLNLSPLTAQLYGGAQTGNLTADLRTLPSAIALNLKLAGVDANQLLSATSSLKNTLYGDLGASGDIHMKLAGDQIARTLNGNLTLNLSKGHLAGTNVVKELSTIGKFVGYGGAAGANLTNITHLGGDIAIVDGVATTNDLDMQMEGGSLSAAGTVNMVDQTLNLKITATLDRAASQKAGGGGIGGMMQTVLSNNKGELMIPAIVSGTFSKPRFEPDAARFAEMKLKSVLPAGPGQTPAGVIIDLFKKKK